MPLKTVGTGDLVRSIVMGVVFILILTGLVPEEAKEAITENLEQLGTVIITLISLIGTLIAFFRKA